MGQKRHAACNTHRGVGRGRQRTGEEGGGGGGRREEVGECCGVVVVPTQVQENEVYLWG